VFKAGDPEVCLRWLASVDNATILTLFAKLAVVTSDDVPTPAALDEMEIEAPFTLDGLFLIWTRASDHEGFLRWLLTLLFENHQQLYLWICQSLQWSLESDLQEEAHGMRARRLTEHGFPPPAEAAAVFLSAPPERLAPVTVAGVSTEPQPDGSAGTDSEAIVAAPPDLPGGVPFLGRCSELLEPRDRFALRAAVDRLSRLILSAELLDPGQPEDRRTALRRAARTISIALEHLAAGDPALGAALCLERSAVDLFRAGHTLVAALHRRATELKRDGWLGKVGGGSQLLEPELRRVFEASRHPRPQRFAGTDEDGKARYEPYATLAEVAEARQVLEQIAAIGRLLVDGLGLPADFSEAIDLAGCLPSSWSEIAVGDILRTALVHGALGGGVRFAPVVPAELARFVSLAVEHRRLRASFRAEAVDVLLARLPADAATLRATLEPYLAVVVDRLEEELGALDPSQPVDPRFVGGLVRRAAG
jgi:hypothetical protein